MAKMAKLDYKSLKARYDEAYRWKLNWMGQYTQYWWYVAPNRNAINMIFSFRNDAMPLSTVVWDGTAMLAARQRANDLIGLLMPKDRRWGSLTFNPYFVQEDEITAHQNMLDDTNKHILWYLNNSNLYRSAGSSALDLNAGGGALYVESVSDDEPLRYYSIPFICLFIEATYDDLVGTCWFKRNFNPTDFMAAFPGYRGNQLGAIQSGQLDMIPVIYGQIKQSTDKYYLYAVPESECEYELFAMESDYQRILVFRDQVRPGEPDGRGIGLDLLPIIQDLNHAVRDHRKFLDFTANPPMFYDTDEYFNPYAVRQWAGAFIPRLKNARNPLEPLQMPTNMDVWQQIQDMRQLIQKGFQVDPLGDINLPTKTATEVAARENRAQRSTTTDLGRLENELPKQVYEVAVKILIERGLISLKEFKRKVTQFQWESPLTDLQKQEDLSRLVQNLQVKQQFFGAGAAIATAKLPEMNDYLTNVLNLPSKLFSSKEELENALKTMGQQGAPQATTAAQPVQPFDATQMERINVTAGQGAG